MAGGKGNRYSGKSDWKKKNTDGKTGGDHGRK